MLLSIAKFSRLCYDTLYVTFSHHAVKQRQREILSMNRRNKLQ